MLADDDNTAVLMNAVLCSVFCSGLFFSKLSRVYYVYYAIIRQQYYWNKVFSFSSWARRVPASFLDCTIAHYCNKIVASSDVEKYKFFKVLFVTKSCTLDYIKYKSIITLLINNSSHYDAFELYTDLQYKKYLKTCKKYPCRKFQRRKTRLFRLLHPWWWIEQSKRWNAQILK